MSNSESSCLRNPKVDSESKCQTNPLHLSEPWGRQKPNKKRVNENQAEEETQEWISEPLWRRNLWLESESNVPSNPSLAE
jgi:hypothetical protein